MCYGAALRRRQGWPATVGGGGVSGPGQAGAPAQAIGQRQRLLVIARVATEMTHLASRSRRILFNAGQTAFNKTAPPACHHTPPPAHNARNFLVLPPFRCTLTLSLW